MTVEPGLERKPLDDPPAGRGRETVEVAEDAVDGVGHCLRARRLVALPALRVRNADACIVADELDGPAARRMDDREPGGHRLEHERRARVLHLRVQQQMPAAQDVRPGVLRVLPDQLHVVGNAQ